MAQQAKARLGWVWHGTRPGKALQGRARSGSVWNLAKSGQAGQGVVVRGKEHGETRHGKAWLGTRSGEDWLLLVQRCEFDFMTKDIIGKDAFAQEIFSTLSPKDNA